MCHFYGMLRAVFIDFLYLLQVKFLDLTAPQYGLAAYDWVISVEVGEHIPAKFQNIYLDNLVRHAREGIVLSWAVPGMFINTVLCDMYTT